MDRSAVIAGAGIGGLTTALALARDGWKVDIYEKAYKLEFVGAGLQLAPNASRILDDLGLMPRLSDIAVETERLVVRSGRSGKPLSSLDHGRSARERWGAPFLVVHRGDLQRALLDAIETEPNISLTLGRRLEDVRVKPDHIRGIFSKYGDEIDVSTGLLIGADGLWSKARSHVGLTGPANFSGCVAWRATIPAAAVGPEFTIPQSNLWLAPGGHVVHYPLRGGREINIVAILEDGWRERGWSESGDAGWINRRFHAWHPDVRRLIGAADHWLRWSLFDRAPDWKWSRGLMTLLGDAAHPMLPCLAQGAGQAIEDAAALAAALRTHPDVPLALKTYETTRIRRTAAVQRQSRRQMRIYHASGPLAAVRDIAMRAIGPAGMARRFDWLYGHGPLSGR